MKKLISISVIAAFLILCQGAGAFSGIGSGTEADPYVITDVNQLQEMKDELDADYVLANAVST